MAEEVAQILLDEGYTVLVQDFDISYGQNFVASMHEALKRCRHLVVLLAKAYDASEYTLLELMSFLAAAARAGGERRLVLLRVEECNPEGFLMLSGRENEAEPILRQVIAKIEELFGRKIVSASSVRPLSRSRFPKVLSPFSARHEVAFCKPRATPLFRTFPACRTPLRGFD